MTIIESYYYFNKHKLFKFYKAYIINKKVMIINFNNNNNFKTSKKVVYIDFCTFCHLIKNKNLFIDEL